MLIFKNPGLIDLTAATTLGVNVKEGATPIGQFGTGLKVAISVVLRLGGVIEIWRGRKLHTFALKKKTIRGKEFRIVTMNGRELGFTDRYGAHWEPWMAYRELWSNCRDEGGEVLQTTEQPDVAARTTNIVVRCRELEAAHDERHKIVIQTTPLVELPGLELHAGQSEYVYYRGIRVAHVPNKKKSIYTYCLTGHQTLTEDRTLAYQWSLPGIIARALVQCTNAAVITDVLTAHRDSAEYALPWRDVKEQKPSPQFMEVAEGLRAANRLAGSALELFKTYLDTVAGYVSPFIVVPTVFQEAVIGDALAMLEAEGIVISRPTLRFKTDHSAVGVRKEAEYITVPSTEIGGTALGLARTLLVYWAREEQAGKLSMAHRILTGEWADVAELKTSRGVGQFVDEPF